VRNVNEMVTTMTKDHINHINPSFWLRTGSLVGQVFRTKKKRFTVCMHRELGQKMVIYLVHVESGLKHDTQHASNKCVDISAIKK